MRLNRLSSTLSGIVSSRLAGSALAAPAAVEPISRRIVALTSITVFFIGISVLLGWQFRIDLLKTPLPEAPSTTPVVALCFPLAAIALGFLDSHVLPVWRRVGKLCAVAVLFVAGQFLLETLFDLNFHIDYMLYHQRLMEEPLRWVTGRPALSTCVALICLGLSLLLNGRRIPGRNPRGWYWSELLCLPALIIGFLGVIGYSLGAHRFVLQTFRNVTPISFYAALCTWILATGVLFSDPAHRLAGILLSSGPGGVLARRVLPLSTVTLFTLGWVGVQISRNQLFDLHVATAVLITAGTFVLAGSVLWTASLLNRDAAARRSAQQSVAYLSAIVEGSNDAIIGKTLDGIISTWNRAAEKLYGYTAAEIIGRSADILIAPDHPNELWKNLQRLAHGEKIEQYETVRRRKDGTVIDVEVAMSPIRDEAGHVIGASSIARDITEAKRAEEKLRRAKREWEQTFDSVPDLIAVLDKNNRVARVNKALAQRLGKSAEACVGQMCYECAHGTKELPAECPHSLTLLDHKQHIAELHEPVLGGDFVVSTTPFFDEQGQLAGVVHVSRDVSELKKAHEALVRSEKLATTGQLAASIAHEIHNPLDAVGNLLYLMQQSTAEEETRNFATMATQELNRVTQITQQMLTFQRESAAPVPVNFQEVLENVLALYDRKIQAANVDIKLEIDAESTILAMPGQTRQVLANLISNAIEARSGNPSMIRLRAYRSRDLRSGQEGLRFVIADNGRGIPAELHRRIFDPFFTTKGENGTGLGLWITLGIIEKSGGSMRVRSTTRQGRSGTCFSLFFPNVVKPVGPALVKS